MTLSNDEFAALGLGLGLGVGLGVGTGATLMSPAFGLGMGVAGIGIGVAGMVAILYATQQKRNGEPEDDDCVESDDVATDGGTVRSRRPSSASRGDWSGAVDRVLAHKLLRWADGIVLEETDAIVACEGDSLERGEQVAVRRVSRSAEAGR